MRQGLANRVFRHFEPRNAARRCEVHVVDGVADIERVRDLVAALRLRIHDAVCADFDQDLAVQVCFGLGDDPPGQRSASAPAHT